MNARQAAHPVALFLRNLEVQDDCPPNELREHAKHAIVYCLVREVSLELPFLFVHT